MKKSKTETEQVEVGDMVLLEQCWEDAAGHYHDEWVEVSRILSDGRLQFRIGHWKTRKTRDQKLQALLNSMEFYPSEVSDIEKSRPKTDNINI